MATPTPQATARIKNQDVRQTRRMLAFGLVLAALVPLLGIGLLSYERANAQARALDRAQLIVQAVDKQLRDRLFLLGRQLDTAAAGDGAAQTAATAAGDPAQWPIPILNLRVAADRLVGATDGRRLLSIGVPRRQAGRWWVPVSRRTVDGRRVHGEIDADLFAEVLQGYSLGDHDRLNVVHADGVMLARSRDNDRHVGVHLDQATLFDAQWRTSDEGTFRGRSDLDGVQREFLFRRLRDLPLIIVVGTEQRSVLATWAGFAGTVFLLSLLLGLSWAWLTRRFAQGKRRQSHLIGELKQTIEALNRTEERLRQAHALAALGEWQLDLGTGDVHWDEDNWRAYGKSASDKPATLDEAFAAVDARDRPALQVRVRELVDGSGPLLDTEYRIRRADGSVRWIHARAELVVAANGHRHVHAVQQDITEVVLTRERLDAAERQYRLMFDINPLPMWVYDLESLQLLAVNESAIAKYGYSRDELLGLTVLDIRPADERAEAAEFLRTTPMRDDSGRAWRHLLKGGAVIHVNNVGVDIDFNGRRACLVLIRDITDQLQAQAAQRASEERFRLVARATSDAVYDLDIAAGTLWWSDSFYTSFGYSPGQVPATLEAWEALVHPDDLARVGASLQAAIDANASEWEEEYRFSCRDGGFAQVIDRGYLLRDADGRATRMVGGMLDVSEKRRSEADVTLLRRAIEVTRNGIVISDARHPGQPVVYVNPAFERITGYSAEDILGRNCRLLQLEDRDQVGIEGIRLALREERETRVVLRNYRKDGTLFYNEFQLAPVRDAAGVLTHYVGVQSDVTERQQYEQQLAYRATHDELTGLPNRQLLLDRLQQMVLVAERHGRAFAVLFIDMDDFKLVNDSLGHSAGDEVLREVARRLRDVVVATDTVGRFGGDEFVVVLGEPADEAALQLVIARISAALVEPIDIAGMLYTLTPSIGYCWYPQAGRSAEALLMRADVAMYQAKQQGRNRAVGYRSEFDTAVSKRLQLVSQLRDALRREEFRLVFQPVFGADGLPTALEALVRWHHPERGLLQPDQFIAVCEESGLIVELGRRVLREAARHHALLVEVGLGHLRIAVNVSAAQFAQDLHADIAAVMHEFALPPGVLELELTESVIMARPEQAIHAMQEIAALGVAISVDDFGTGYSSLAYLKRLPIERLKIDQSFVRDLGIDEDDAAICASIIGLAHSLDLATVGEGVETAQQHAWLLARGCDEIQGYLLGRPQPFEQLLPALLEPIVAVPLA